MLIGQRWDMNIAEEIRAEDSGFSKLKGKIRENGSLHPPTGSDYFVFPRSSYLSVPDFAIGRAGWDNWFIYRSRWKGWLVVDATHDVTIIHQNHDYAHLPDGKPHYRLPETAQNVKMGGGDHTIFFLSDAQYTLADHHLIRKKLTWKKLLREVEIFPLSKKRSQFFGKLFFFIFNPKKGYAALRKYLRKLLEQRTCVLFVVC